MEKEGFTQRAQVSFEYIVIMGFVTFIIIGILGVSFLYSNSIKDRIKMIQVNNFGNKVVSSAESVFYAGEPSKITIKGYLPEGVEEVDIQDDYIFISIQLSSGFTKISFSSEVPIQGSITNSPGVKNVEIEAQEDVVVISPV